MWGASKVCMAPFHKQSKVYIAPMYVRSKFADFALHMDGSHADFAPHIEQRHRFRDQKKLKLQFLLTDLTEFVQTTYI